MNYLSDPSNFAELVRSAVVAPTPPVRTTVELAALQHAVEVEVPAIGVPDGIVDAICALRAGLRRKELIASDRRWRQAVRLLQASAYLDGRTEVCDTDLSVLIHVLWDSPAERSTVERAVLELVNPDAGKALDLADAIEELEAALDAKAGQAAETLSEWAIKEANPKLKRAGKELATMRAQAEAAGRSTATLDRVIGRQRAVQARVLSEALGVDASALAGQL
ncbi:hypothetical protein [Prauserella muralis]|uniref:hypothetical protein n=1 Tax=Prauserella muralis TaxID=588067 RepID=UPI001BA52706|nr:hypothetical protein [Prauserella muralis]